jgi:hypothetical protein
MRGKAQSPTHNREGETQMAKYKIVVADIFVKKAQGVAEGKLELRGLFTANGVQGWYPSPSAHVCLSLNEHVSPQLAVGQVENQTTVSVTAELWELEPGSGQGGTDHGITTGTLSLGPGQTTPLDVTISKDSMAEHEGIVTVTFEAVEIPPDNPGGGTVTGSYQISLDRIDIVRGQQTGSGVDWEGELELRARITAGTTELWLPSSSSYFPAKQGDQLTPGTILTTVKDVATVQVKAELWELEPGGMQGGTDFGQATGTLNVITGSQTLIVTTSADNWKEKSAIVTFRFLATKVAKAPIWEAQAKPIPGARLVRPK